MRQTFIFHNILSEVMAKKTKLTHYWENNIPVHIFVKDGNFLIIVPASGDKYSILLYYEGRSLESVRSIIQYQSH